MKITLVFAIFAALALSLSSCSSVTPSASEPQWYPYGALKVYKQLGDDHAFIIKGRSPVASGITIMHANASRMEIDVTEIGEAYFKSQGMFSVEVDGKRLTAAEAVGRMASNPTQVPRRGGRVSYELPAYYEKIVINFFNVDLKGFTFSVKLISP